MIRLQSFTFNPFQENTYLLWDDSRECIIIDPGCYTVAEKQILASFIEDEKLKPVRLLNTHAHIDHILGNAFVCSRYGIQPEIHPGEMDILRAAPVYGEMWGIQAEPSPEPCRIPDPGDRIHAGKFSLEILFTPGHSPASVSFYSPDDRLLIGGDVLFYESIGRTDLPGGDYDTLICSIRERLFVLPPETKVYAGHGPATSISHEMEFNPFLSVR
ncbi:MAG: MBL fold metallo-hydrolase [Bacteroidia bacterium]|nr:MBL fold metallo-hydrolase [Bacteroidia bacterium]